MNWLPEDSDLGTLEMVEIFVEYDGPRVFHCRNLSGQNYLAEWAVETDTYGFWLFVPVSPNRLGIVRSGGIALRRAFEEPEEGLIFGVTLPNAGSLGEVEALQRLVPSDLEDEWLPAAGFSLSLETDTLPMMKSPEALHTVVVQESRARLRLEVKLSQKTRSEAPTRLIAELLSSTQNTVDNFGAAIASVEHPPQRGMLPPETLALTSSDLVALEAASFVIELASSEFEDLLGDSLFAEASRKVVHLLDPVLSHQDLVAELQELQPRAAQSFRNFVGVLSDSGADVAIATASAAKGFSDRRLLRQELAELYLNLQISVPEEKIALRGTLRLYKIDTVRHQFGVRDYQLNDKFEGSIDELAFATASHATAENLYDVLIHETSDLDIATGNKTTKYRLMQLSDPSDPPSPVVRQQIT